MLSRRNYIFVTVLHMINVFLVCSECYETFWMVCENVSDVASFDITKRSWTQLFIEPKHHKAAVPNGTLQRHHLRLLDNLEQLFIINHLKRIDYKAFDHDRLKKSLKYLVLYGNNLRMYISRNAFTFDNLRKLSLVNNNIEWIDPCVFDHSKIETIDLSYNKQRVLPDYMFCNCEVSKLIVRHNQLSKIKPQALPRGLKFLHLDHNNFYFLSMTNLNNTLQIEELTLSYNKFNFIDDLSTLVSLKRLDLSFNSIHKVSNELDSFKHLRVLNLSGNNLMKFSFPAFVNTDNFTDFLILLAYNRLRNLDLETVIRKNRITLALFGNPWNCQCLRKMEEIMDSAFGKVYNIDCKEASVRCETIPFCVVVDSYYEECSDDQISDERFVLFRKLFGTDVCNSGRIFQEYSTYIPPPPIVFGLPPA